MTVPGAVLFVEGASVDPVTLLGALRRPEPIPAALELLTAGGFGALPAFALLEHRGQSAHYVVRGGIELSFFGPEGERTASGAGITTWTEQLISGVDGFTIAAEGTSYSAAHDGALPLVEGALWGDRIEWRPATDDDDAAGRRITRAEPARSAERVENTERAASTEHVRGTGADAADTAAPATSPVPAAPGPAGDVSQETLLPPTLDGSTLSEHSIPPMPGFVEDSLPVPEGTTGYDHLFGVTVMKNVESAAVRPPGEDEDVDKPTQTQAPAAAPAPAPAPAQPTAAGDHDGLTMMSGDIAELRRRAAQAGAPEPGAAPAATPKAATATPIEAQFRLELPDGTHETLDRPTIVGRSPSASRVSGGELPRLLTVGGTDPDISRNHVRFTVEGGTVVITDLHSRNGTVISLPGRPPQKLREGEPTSALAGTVVDLGGGIRITVAEVGSAAGN
ncbi:MAG TPA: FHA domain-containing protein [Gryllotalpicola sp.]